MQPLSQVGAGAQVSGKKIEESESYLAARRFYENLGLTPGVVRYLLTIWAEGEARKRDQNLLLAALFAAGFQAPEVAIKTLRSAIHDVVWPA